MKPSFCRFQIRACNDRDGTLIISNGYNDVITSPYVRLEVRLSVPSLAKASSYVQSAELTFASLGLNDLSTLLSEIYESFELFLALILSHPFLYTLFSLPSLVSFPLLLLSSFFLFFLLFF